MTADGEWVRLVQRRALERALVDDVDARRYFALAGSLDRYRDAETEPDAEPTTSGEADTTGGASVSESGPSVEGVLPAALVSLAVVPFLDSAGGASTPSSPSAPGPTSAPTLDPWPVDDPARPAIRRGARLALRWFDVQPERVAARAGVPETVLTAPVE
ncbi:hypothetical protein C2R22_10625 [Salinigranum rubrum]|uniref:Uncharacterized protein n=1 Tax=Salinigranum rubrum TaxID=755307 RepID=A0A2I8VJF3_9EURY|nr:hypothetical protein [Salinigranum rubrum]AUV82050.1 hypothetical protein C2R22_10625 [Salinigranum rubrum]